MMKRFVLATALALCACGSSSNSGSNGGTTAAFVIQPTTCSVTAAGVTQNVSVTGLVIATPNRSLGNACTAAANVCSVNYKNLTTFLITAVNPSLTGGTAAAVGPGTYAFNDSNPLSPPLVFAFETQTDANCAEVGSGLGAKAGTVTLTSVGSTVSGSYQFTMTDNTTRSGSFSGSNCGSTLPAGEDFCETATGGGPTCTGTPACQ